MALPRFLIVDDEKPVRIVLVEALECLGYEVEAAESGEAALSALEDVRFDFIISDIIMPGMNGYELIYKIIDKWPSMEQKFVLISGKTFPSKIQGSIPVFPKPVSLPVLEEILDYLCVNPDC